MNTLTAAIKEYLGNAKIAGADHAMEVCVGDDLGAKMYDNNLKVDHKTLSTGGQVPLDTSVLQKVKHNTLLGH